MKLRITVEGKVYEVDVEVVPENAGSTPVAPVTRVASAPVAAPAPAASQAPAPVAAHDETKCVSPLPGTVLKVNVKAGESVTRNQTLMVLDAMKMETNIPSPVEGKVKAVHAEVGAIVKQGELLVEFE